MDEVKKAFQKVKEDIVILSESIKEIREHIIFFHKSLNEIFNELKIQKEKFEIHLIDKQKNEQNSLSQIPTHVSYSTDRQTTNNLSVETIPTHNLTYKDLKDQNLNVSIGNQGVPADRQTDQQTDNQTHFPQFSSSDLQLNLFENASQLLDSLDGVKKVLRRQFKQLTDQEFLIFSTIYNFEESNPALEINYSILATTLKLTESSIRDYIARLIQKGIPIEKTKINNKKIHLSISPNLKKIANLSTIMSLRDL